MRVFSGLGFLLGTVAVGALPQELRGTSTGVTCGTTFPDSFGDMTRNLAGVEHAHKLAENDFDNVTINVYFHVVAAVEGSPLPEDGYLSPSQIYKVFDYINDHFKPHGFDFVIKEIDYTYSREYSDHTDPHFDSEALGRLTRKGDLLDLNIWSATNLAGAAQGYCAVPSISMTLRASEGCVVKYDDFVPLNRGEVSVHEMGHWLGLGHTFQERRNGTKALCEDPDNDGVDDTPVHLHDDIPAKVFFQCLDFDTCPELEGSDPVSNPMNYLWPKCQGEFTPGQGVRMHNTWENVRKVANEQLKLGL